MRNSGVCSRRQGPFAPPGPGPEHRRKGDLSLADFASAAVRHMGSCAGIFAFPPDGETSAAA